MIYTHHSLVDFLRYKHLRIAAKHGAIALMAQNTSDKYILSHSMYRMYHPIEITIVITILSPYEPLLSILNHYHHQFYLNHH